MKFLFVLFLLIKTVHSSDLYTEKIRPIFDNRCIACHACYDAPCQLNLQDHTGFTRGGSKEPTYNGYRVVSTAPTRLWIDAFSEKEWRKKGFFSVNNSRKASDSIFYQILASKKDGLVPEDSVVSSNTCAADKDELKDFLKEYPDKGMPYGLPKLGPEQLSDIKAWIEAGAPGPKNETLKHDFEKDIKAWEYFLNRKDNEHKLVSRYLYEHLFLAHISFSKERTNFFRLIRTALPCEKNGEEIATRTPNEDPRTEDLFYCFRPYPGTIVAKTHLPLVLNGEKLKRYQEIFFGKKDWKVTVLPKYDRLVSANPFMAFKDIPTRARYEYLLEDARYHVNAFIKGPVCNGSAAVNSIQEQFFVSFIAPEADVMIQSEAFERESRDDLLLPGIYGSDVRVNKTPMLGRELTEKREKFRSLKKSWLRKIRPAGLSYGDIWKGTAKSPGEGFLTVFRHDDNASVLYGYVGDISKTLFFLDYSLFERLVYNLVVNFDVYGNIGHQTLTRIYMDLIRMEAEENFLAFLPPEERRPLRASWYKGYLTKLKMDYIYPDVLDDMPVNIKYQNPKDAKRELVENLRRRTQVKASLAVTLARPGKNNFANYFPELTFVRVAGKESRVFSIVRNREHENVSWILAEEYRLAPEEDSLTLVNGFAGAYPNLFLEVAETNFKDFISEIKELKSPKDYALFIEKYGVKRTDQKFWELYDSMNEAFLKFDAFEAGHLDLTRYGIYPATNPFK